MGNDFEAYWEDCLKQKTYAIYQGEGEEAEYLGIVNGHDENHARSKFAQYDERDPKTLTVSRAWPNSKH